MIRTPHSTKQSVRRAACVLLVLAMISTVPHALRSQGTTRDNLGEFYSYGDNYFIEVATLPGRMGGKARALVTFRLSYDLLTFRTSSRQYQVGGLFETKASMYVEAIGSDGIIVGRGNWIGAVQVQEYARTNSKTDYLCGAIELALRPGIYTLKYTLDDGAPGSGFTQTTAPFTVDEFGSPSPAIGTPIFLDHTAGDTLVTTSIDGAARFGRRLRAFIPLASPVPLRSLRYEVALVPKKDEPARVLHTGAGMMLGPVAIGEALTAGNDVALLLVASPDSDRSYGAFIDCSTDDMPVGDYLLTIVCEAGQNSVTDSVRVRLRWVDMPFSLSRPEYAIRAMYPIATDDALDELLSGSREQQRLAVEAYWKRRDPTPSTEMNEAMVEYYRRVDYAFFNFRGVGQTDGVFTDRGRIYLLYGPPTEVARDMQPNAPPREVWVYQTGPKRRFVFQDDARGGDYRLVEYNDL